MLESFCSISVSAGVNTPVFTKTAQRGGTVEQGPHGKLRSAKRLRLLTPGSEKSRSLRTRGTLMVEICTGGKVMLHFALAGSGAPVQTNGLRFQARQRYASKAAVLCVQSHAPPPPTTTTTTPPPQQQQQQQQALSTSPQPLLLTTALGKCRRWAERPKTCWGARQARSE